MIIKRIAILAVGRLDLRSCCGLRNFVLVKTGFSCLCVTAESTAARCMVFQQPPSWSKISQQPVITWYRSPFCLKPCENINGVITSPSLVTTQNTMMWTGRVVLIYININVLKLIPKHSGFLYQNFHVQFQAVQQAVSKFLENYCCLSDRQCPTDSSVLDGWKNSEINNLNTRNSWFQMVTICQSHPGYQS